MTEPIVNDLTIQAATVNGSGSQTANLVLTRAIFKMGIPVAPKNVFPSNIEGLPTWYQLRVTPQGHMARSDRVDVLVAFNVATWRDDPMTGKVEGKVLVEGNQAAALGALMGGVTVAAWYPITPSSSLCEYLIAYADRFRVDPKSGEKRISVVQAEDELAAVGMAIGAAWAGARAMTSTSGPGISLMAEFAGLAYYAEVPVVIFDIQRIGPSTGVPTRTSQGDLAFASTLSHGDTKHIVLLPGTVEECYEFGRDAFDHADRFQTPVFVLSDLDLGMNLWMTPEFKYPEKPFDRGKVLSKEDLEKAAGEWARYRDVDGAGVTYRTLPGTDHPAAGYFTRGSGHDELARYTEGADAYARNMDRLSRKLETARQALPAPVADEAGAPVGLIAFGSTHAAIVEARQTLAEAGKPVDYLRVRALPLSDEIADFVRRHERVYVVEQNRDGQLYDIIRLALPADLVDRVRSIRHYNGQPIPAVAIIEPLQQLEAVPA